MFALVFFHNSVSQNVADADCTLSTTHQHQFAAPQVNYRLFYEKQCQNTQMV
ncbi:hypothetical protein Psal072_03748 (plasmid) [Piscirickettsia salmonis]|uniref:Uncharacterized protein n=1 Tax=Piscirickettsia salmonis TaxID=1238 RepID=A0A9Q6LIM8_PISSA|nr:integrase [Piscirickettsia salmonis]QGO04551.1 hypothetical protein Psal009_00420 [Piscirickettsia salmonis]QGO35941.1 hypothetical protein Psal028_03324 [Piscirickettsia salmonis]QGO39540.1 hypothetical protein Psal040_03313 [Piscirickettsia salmonis]QGO46905.1 hypothetical protein Psal051_03494 [Piscirickettsia salmonis]